MTDSMYGWCSTARDGLHQRKAIGYEKTAVPPTMERGTGGSIKITKPAYFRYFVVWVCEVCAKTWWVEDHPQIADVAS